MKTRVKKEWVRKLLPWKETEDAPYLYVRIIPLFIQILFFIGVLIFYCFVWFSDLVPDSWFHTGWYMLIFILETFLCWIWFGILQLTGPSTKEEKEQAKILKKVYRENKRKEKEKKKKLKKQKPTVKTKPTTKPAATKPTTPKDESPPDDSDGEIEDESPPAE